jgi:hypothetical protein
VGRVETSCPRKVRLFGETSEGIDPEDSSGGRTIELFICVLTNLRGLKRACFKTQKVLTGWYAETPYAFKKKEVAYGAPEALHPSILSRYIETEF